MTKKPRKTRKARGGVPEVSPQYLYFIQCGHERGPIKIGYATDVGGRLSGMQTDCPYPLTCLIALRLSDAPAAEYSLHQRFAKHRMRGEWFEWNEDLAWLIRDMQAQQEAKLECVMTTPQRAPSTPPERTDAPLLRVVR